MTLRTPVDKALDQAIYERLNYPVDHFPPEYLKSLLRSLNASPRRTKQPPRLSPGQIRHIPGKRAIVITLRYSKKTNSWQCVPIHSYPELQGPGDIPIGANLFAETWLPCLIPSKTLETATDYGSIPAATLKTIRQATPQEITIQPVPPTNSTPLKGAVVVFRSIEIQIVLSTILMGLLDGELALPETTTTSKC